eukprot:752991-Hanusia_phi.AAC.5
MQNSNMKSSRRSVAMVCPRKKRSLESQLYETDMYQDEPVILTRELLESFFDRPLVAVSQELGICPTAIKRACRKLGIARWPFKTPNPGPKRKRIFLQPLRLASSSSEPTDVESLSCESPIEQQSSSTDSSVDFTFDDICEVVNQSSDDLWTVDVRPFVELDERSGAVEVNGGQDVISAEELVSSFEDDCFRDEDQLHLSLFQADEVISAPCIWN